MKTPMAFKIGHRCEYRTMSQWNSEEHILLHQHSLTYVYFQDIYLVQHIDRSHSRHFYPRAFAEGVLSSQNGRFIAAYSSCVSEEDLSAPLLGSTLLESSSNECSISFKTVVLSQICLHW